MNEKKKQITLTLFDSLQIVKRRRRTKKNRTYTHYNSFVSFESKKQKKKNYRINKNAINYHFLYMFLNLFNC